MMRETNIPIVAWLDTRAVATCIGLPFDRDSTLNSSSLGDEEVGR